MKEEWDFWLELKFRDEVDWLLGPRIPKWNVKGDKEKKKKEKEKKTKKKNWSKR